VASHLIGKMIQKGETYAIIGFCMEIYNELGYGFSEVIYKDAIEIEVIERNIPICREKEFEVYYKGRKMGHRYFADFVLFNNIIVEVKSCSGIANEHIAQILNYLKVSGNKVGLIINFGKQSLEFKRVIL
jgi:GxxExxY protein